MVSKRNLIKFTKPITTIFAPERINWLKEELELPFRILPKHLPRRIHDHKTAEAKERLFEAIQALRAEKIEERSSLEVLRMLRGYRS